MDISRYRLSHQSRLDLDDIWLHIASDNLTAADRFVDGLVGKFQTLAAQPGVGRLRDELDQGLRSFPVGNYVSFYRGIQDGIEVVPVLSGFRDIPSVFAAD